MILKENVLSESVKNAVEDYQCSGCGIGGDITCYKNENIVGKGCSAHSAGTFMGGIGKIFLGMPKGFNRLGETDLKIYMFTSFEKHGGYDKFNVPAWKHVNEKGHTIVRGISPRINKPWIHIYLEDCSSQIDCYEVTNNDIEAMD